MVYTTELAISKFSTLSNSLFIPKSGNKAAYCSVACGDCDRWERRRKNYLLMANGTYVAGKEIYFSPVRYAICDVINVALVLGDQFTAKRKWR